MYGIDFSHNGKLSCIGALHSYYWPITVKKISVNFIKITPFLTANRPIIIINVWCLKKGFSKCSPKKPFSDTTHL